MRTEQPLVSSGLCLTRFGFLGKPCYTGLGWERQGTWLPQLALKRSSMGVSRVSASAITLAAAPEGYNWVATFAIGGMVPLRS